ncbi:hypothetical protein ACX818_001306 [Acinetobacter baumannii]
MTTISRALVTIKHSKAQFGSTLRDMKFSGVFRNGTEISTGIKAAEFTEQSRKNYQSITDKLNAEFDLRCKVNKANFENEVEVNGKKMTINDALTYRTHILPQLKLLHSTMSKELAAARSLFISTERDFDIKMSKVSADDELKTLMEKREKPTILDIQKQVDELKKEIDFFELEFDAILTERNPLIVID